MRISAIITCHNEEAYVEQAVRSVHSQTAADAIIEIIVVNDGSTDNSGVVLEGLLPEIPKLRIIEADGRSIGAGRNCGIRAATGDAIAFLDGDDYWPPEKLARQIAALESHPSVGLVYGDYVDFTLPDAADRLFVHVRRFNERTKHTQRDYFLHDGPVLPSTALIRRQVFDEVGLFDEVLRYEETDLWLRVADHWHFLHVPDAPAFKRRHARRSTRRLDTFLPASHILTDLHIKRRPDLAPYGNMRLARRYSRAGNDCVERGERRLALKYIGTAIRFDPFFWRSYVYLMSVFLPVSWVARIQRGAKVIFHDLKHFFRYRRGASRPTS